VAVVSQGLLNPDPDARLTVASVLSRSVFNGKDPTVNVMSVTASIQEKLDQIIGGQERIHDDMTAGFSRLEAQLADVRVCVQEGNHRLLSTLLEGKTLLRVMQDRLVALMEQQGTVSPEVSRHPRESPSTELKLTPSWVLGQVLARELSRQTSRFEEALVGIKQSLDPERIQDKAALELLSQRFTESREELLREVREGRGEARHMAWQLSAMVKAVEDKVRAHQTERKKGHKVSSGEHRLCHTSLLSTLSPCA
jgi:hypothetical protein